MELMKHSFCALLACCSLLVTSDPVLGATPQSKFFEIYITTQEAEQFENNGDLKGALQRYRKIHERLTQLKEENPNWEPSVVNYRLKNVGEIVAELEFRTGRQQENTPDPSKVIKDGSLKTGMEEPVMTDGPADADPANIADPEMNEPSSPTPIQAEPLEKVDQGVEFPNMPYRPTQIDDSAFEKNIEALRQQFNDALTQLSEAKKREGNLTEIIDVFKKENRMLADEYSHFVSDTKQKQARLTEKANVFERESKMLVDENARIRAEAKKREQQLHQKIDVVQGENRMLADAYSKEAEHSKGLQKVATNSVLHLEKLRMQIGSLRSLMKLRRDSLNALLAQNGLKNDQSTRSFVQQLEQIASRSEKLLHNLESQRHSITPTPSPLGL